MNALSPGFGSFGRDIVWISNKNEEYKVSRFVVLLLDDTHTPRAEEIEFLFNYRLLQVVALC